MRRRTDAEIAVSQRWVCEARGVAPGDCGGRLEVHHLKHGNPWREICGRYPEAMLSVCRVHHVWIGYNRRQALELGLAWDEGTARRRLAELGWKSRTEVG